MSNPNNESNNVQNQKIQEELNDLKNKYSNLLKEMQVLENNKDNINSLKQDIKSIHDGFEQINKNVEQLNDKLNTISQESQMNNQMKKMMRNPLRRLMVGTVSSVMFVVDKAVETTSGIRENLEDIVAEAQYENKKKRMNIKEEH